MSLNSRILQLNSRLLQQQCTKDLKYKGGKTVAGVAAAKNTKKNLSGKFFVVQCCSIVTTVTRKVMVWQKCFITMFIFIAIFSFFLFTPNYTFPCYMAPLCTLGIIFQQAYGFKCMGLDADESGRFISATFHRHGIQTKPWLQFYSEMADVLKFDREIRNGCLWHTVSLFIWPRHSSGVLFTFPLFSPSLFAMSESQRSGLD